MLPFFNPAICRFFSGAIALACTLILLSSASQANDLASDPDFALQGEYVGTCWVPGIGQEQVGLQVVAQGEQKFLAVRYRGGLPGAGWDQQLKESLTGDRSSGKLVLSGAGQSIEIESAIANVFDPQKQLLGTLKKVTRTSPLLGRPAPAGAITIFGKEPHSELNAFVSAKHSAEGWLSVGALMQQPVQNFHLHLEFRTPFMPTARGQARGNSGVYIQQRYELQILDSFGLEGIENECGSLYKQQRPALNMCFPPMQWQTYDVIFTSPRFYADGVTKCQNAQITVWHNGVAIHCNRDIFAKTGAGKAERPTPLPINFQDHNDAVEFRNIWLLPTEDCTLPDDRQNFVFSRGRSKRGLFGRASN